MASRSPSTATSRTTTSDSDDGEILEMRSPDTPSFQEQIVFQKLQRAHARSVNHHHDVRTRREHLDPRGWTPWNAGPIIPKDDCHSNSAKTRWGEEKQCAALGTRRRSCRCDYCLGDSIERTDYKDTLGEIRGVEKRLRLERGRTGKRAIDAAFEITDEQDSEPSPREESLDVSFTVETREVPLLDLVKPQPRRRHKRGYMAEHYFILSLNRTLSDQSSTSGDAGPDWDILDDQNRDTNSIDTWDMCSSGSRLAPSISTGP